MQDIARQADAVKRADVGHTEVKAPPKPGGARSYEECVLLGHFGSVVRQKLSEVFCTASMRGLLA